MKKISLISSLLLLSLQVQADCTLSDGINLCLDEVNPDLSKVLTASKQVGDLNGDGFEDLIKKENAQGIDSRIVVYLGKACGSGAGSSACFSAPHMTSIYPIKGFEVADLDADGDDDLVVRDGLDQIKVYSFGELPIDPPEVVSLLGTHGLTLSSYTASSLYPGSPEGYRYVGAFDGYRYNGSSPIVPVPGARQGYGTWTSKSGNTTNQWLKVAFATATSVSSFTIYAKTAYEERLPKNVTIQVSNDGVNFTDHESLTLQPIAVQTITLSDATPYANYFRLYMHDAQTGASHIQIDELLLSGWVAE